MRKSLALLAAATALTAAIGTSAFSAMHAIRDTDPAAFATSDQDMAQSGRLILASSDDDEEDDSRGKARRDRDADDEDCNEDDDGDDESDDDDCDSGAGAANPEPAGTVAPPQNGLFGNGAPPQVQVN